MTASVAILFVVNLFWAAPRLIGKGPSQTSQVVYRRFLGTLRGMRPCFISLELIFLLLLTIHFILKLLSRQGHPFGNATLQPSYIYIHQQASACSTINIMHRQGIALALVVLALSNYGKPCSVFRCHSLILDSTCQHTCLLARELKRPQLTCLLMLYLSLSLYISKQQALLLVFRF